ncbi:M14 family metallopeptidase [Leeuwenhoekiella palythoae]|uniref:Zinc carboxypeptidase n=1 Tax=Leeuwenhoekiella palythoae TaxID=573501 RepID=A0A1M5YYN0_9FLAO|nr:M14 family metallopeptidase [Leeuwenhoekiella palythoae]RXG29634.1 hypothetical protein DSM01_1736 [Leeuwenhoekiella palythoae]SHI16643.1 hypothetical protein SAMN04487999_2460 [Leeuwenhoekiella palythoae]
MKASLLSLLFLLTIACAEKPKPEDFDLVTPFEKGDGNQTPIYDEVMAYYEDLDAAYVSIKTYKIGRTDSGEPLTLVTYNTNRTFDSEFADAKEVTRILINNGIHPGESDGIDATMMMMRDLANGTIETPENVWIGAIAVYNIGGALNRNTGTRANQNGPEEYGFRGNAQNYDLNRDFVKADTYNARAFAEIYHMVNPDVLIDNHVSNGADYQYVLTHLFTQHNKLGDELGDYLHTELQPQLEQDLAAKDWPITPYVNVFNQVPEIGFSQFMDYPRYSTGYSTLWNTFGMMVETHMLKPYKDRVTGTYELMKSMIKITEKDGAKMQALRKAKDSLYRSGALTGQAYTLQFEIDSSRTSTLNFLGYEGEQKTSTVTGMSRLKYDRNKPFEKEVTYYNYMKPASDVTIPAAYIIPQGWRHVIERLKENEIDFERFQKDSMLTAEVYHIADYKTRNQVYEGHYLHYNTEVETSTQEIKIRKGDYWVKTNQSGLRYIMEMLEPSGVDSFFNWNYFDTILQQKEHFSPYVWEDRAQELLDADPELKEAFDTKKQEDARFAQNWYAQLEWIYEHSDNYEKAYLRYPIFRITN